MWSCRLNKIKGSNFAKSIANSASLAEVLNEETYLKTQKQPMHSDFFIRIWQWQYLLELFIASIFLALLLALAEAGAWSALDSHNFIIHLLYINWTMLVFIAVLDVLRNFWQRLSSFVAMFAGFLLLQLIVLITTCSLNILFYWGSNFSLQNLSWQIVFDEVSLYLGYAVLLGAFGLRYIYTRGEWLKQQKSELNARIQAMQARIHPHFLFNSLNSVVSLIGSDPVRAEQMLIDLSRLFRASFQELKLVTLKEEIQLCKHYLAIESVRLGSRLNVEWNIQHPEQLANVNIPLLTLQPLLENSIFYGIEPNHTGARIAILVEILQNQVTIVITNPYIQDRMGRRDSNGIALENVRQRLKAYFGYAVQFRTHAGSGIFTTFIQYQYK